MLWVTPTPGLVAATPTGAKLSPLEVNRQLQSVPGWKTVGQELRCTYQFANFVEAIGFINRLLPAAEAASHHPDLQVAYNKVTLNLTTHDAGGLTLLDFQLAEQIAKISHTSCLK